MIDGNTNLYFDRFIGIIPDKKTAATPCWCEDQRDQEKYDRYVEISPVLDFLDVA